MELEATRDIGVVIVHYRRDADLGETLRLVIDVEGVPAHNVVVADNGSFAETAPRYERRFDGLIWLSLSNQGYAAAANAGERVLPEGLPYLVVMTHEVALAPTCLAQMRRELVERPNSGLVGPLLMTPDGSTVWSAGGRASLVRRRPYNSLKGKPRPPSLPHRLETRWLDGAVVMLRRADFRRLGGFAEFYFLYFEDLDLAHRVKRDLGKKVMCVTSASAIQSPGGHLDTYLATRNLLWYFRRSRQWLPFTLYLLENVIRLLIGPIGRPHGAAVRMRARWRGVVHGARRPPIARQDLSTG